MKDLRCRADLLDVTGDDDAFARLDPADPLTGWTEGRTVAVLRRSGMRPPNVFVWGRDVGGLLDALLAGGVFTSADIAGVSVPFDQRDEIHRRFTVDGGGDWEWFWTKRRTGPHRHTGRLVELDDQADAAEIAALGQENPRFDGWPGSGANELWLGIRDEKGDLVACGAVQRLPSGAAHLGGILVARRVRRQGYGTAVSAALTDRIVEAEGVCTLSMYADNDGARALYTSLGYVVDKAWSSRRIVMPDASLSRQDEPTH